MFKTIIVSLFLVFSGLSAFADEVAMVTSVEGTVNATIEGDSWAVELAELLPDGVEIRVAADGSMVIAHMLDNVEYSFSGGAEAVISQYGVEGNNFAKKSFDLVSTSLTLGADSSHQAGTADLGRAGSLDIAEPILEPAVSDESMAPTLSEVRSDDNFAPPMPPPPPMPARDTLIDEKAASWRASRMPDREQPVDAKKKSVSLAKSVSVSMVHERHALFFAIPEELLINETSSIQDISINGFSKDECKIASNNSGWLIAQLSLPSDEKLSELVVVAGDIQLNLEVVSELKTDYTIVNAWQLEKAGCLSQAAYFWLKLLEHESVSEKKAALHLKRIRGKMLQ